MNIIVKSDVQDSDFLHKFLDLTKSSVTYVTCTYDDLVKHDF